MYLGRILSITLGKKGKNCMTDKIFFDTDCLSAFLWIKNENILVKLYGGKIVLPVSNIIRCNTTNIFFTKIAEEP